MEKTNMLNNIELRAETREESSISNFLSEDAYQATREFLTSPENYDEVGDYLTQLLLSSHFYTEKEFLSVIIYRLDRLAKLVLRCVINRYDHRRIAVFNCEKGLQIGIQDFTASDKYRAKFVALEDFLTASQMDVINCCRLCSLLLTLVKAHATAKEIDVPGWLSTVDRWESYGVITK